jgi:ornithine cyclodeaminase
MNLPFSIIDGRTIRDLLRDDLEGCIRVVRAAYLAHAEGRSVNPNSLFLTFPGRPRDRIIALPAHLAAPWNVSGIKWISSYPANVARGFPRASAVLVLNDAETGYPFACLESSVISAARTAASAVLAAQHLVGPERRIRSLGVVGTGLISRAVYRFLTGTGWEIDEVLLHDLDQAAAERFLGHVSARGRHKGARIMPDARSLISACDVVLFATTAGTPHIHERSLFAHRPVVLHLSLRDLAPELLLESWNVVDDFEHVLKAQTSPHLAEQRSGSRAFLTATIAEVVTGAKTVDRSRPIIFSPFGMGILDLAVGKWIYDRAVAAHRHHPIDDFFGDEEP